MVTQLGMAAESLSSFACLHAVLRRSVGGKDTGVWHSLDVDLLGHELDCSLEQLSRAAPGARVHVMLTSPEDYIVAKVNQAAAGEQGAQGGIHGVGGLHQLQQSAHTRVVASLSAAGASLQARVNDGDVHSFGLSSSSLAPEQGEQRGGAPAARSFHMDMAAVLGSLVPHSGFRCVAHPMNARVGGQHAALSDALLTAAHREGRTMAWAQSLDGTDRERCALVAVSPLQDRSWGELQLGWPAAGEGNSPQDVQAEFQGAWGRMMGHIAPLLQSDNADELEAGKWIQGFLQEAISKPVAAFPQHAQAAGMTRAWTHWQEHLMSTSTNLTEAFEELDETTAQLLQQLFMASTRAVLCAAGQQCTAKLAASLGGDGPLVALDALFAHASGAEAVPVAGAFIDVQPHTSGLAQFAFQAPGRTPWQGATKEDFALGAEWTAAKAWSNTR